MFGLFILLLLYNNLCILTGTISSWSGLNRTGDRSWSGFTFLSTEKLCFQCLFLQDLGLGLVLVHFWFISSLCRFLCLQHRGQWVQCSLTLLSCPGIIRFRTRVYSSHFHFNYRLLLFLLFVPSAIVGFLLTSLLSFHVLTNICCFLNTFCSMWWRLIISVI